MWKGRLSFLCALAYVAGCLLCELVPVPPLAALASFSISILLSCLTAIRSHSSRCPSTFLLPCLLSLLLASGAVNATLCRPSSRLLQYCGREADICGIVTGKGHSSKGKPRLEIRVGREKIYLYVGPSSDNAQSSSSCDNPSAIAGLWDTVRCRIQVRPAENFSNDFDYVAFLARKGIFVTTYLPESEVFVSQRAMHTRIGTFARKAASHEFSIPILQGDEMATLKSLLVGDKEGLSSELKDSYMRSGAMHLLAVSGLHVGIIYLILCKLLALIPGNGKRMGRCKSALAILALCFYSWVCGMAPSVCRAVLMATIYEAGRCIESRENSLGAISASAILICAFSPAAPVSVSFQLSFCAVLGIRLVYPWLSKLFKSRSKLLSYAWQVAAMSIACQVGTAPVTWYHFKMFPKNFLLTNLVAIPLVTVIMYSILPAVTIAAIPFTDDYSLKILRYLICLLNNFIKIVGDI
jgi:competence protein ComEC